MYFKLYEELSQELSQDNLDNHCSIENTSEWIDTFRSNVKKLSQDKLNNLYLLIRYDYILENKDNGKIKFPYNSKQLKNGVKFDLDNFSDKLKKMVVLFVNKNLKII